MEEDKYKNRELDEMFSVIDEKLTRIENQTIKTNGRVNSLEKWQSYIKGGLAVIVLLLVPIAIYFIQQTISSANLHEQIQSAVEDALSSMVVSVTESQ